MRNSVDLRSIAQKALPHTAVLLLFLIINSLFFYPQFSGKQMGQGDINESPGRAQEIIEHRKETGEQALWTNNIFVGHPSFYSGLSYQNHLRTVENALKFYFDRPIGTFIGLMTATYIALILLGLPAGIAAIGAIGFGFATNNIILYEAGHMMKIGSLAYMPFIVGGLILLLRKKFLNGFLLYTLGLGLSIFHAHIQMLYYMMLIVMVLGLMYLMIWVKEQKFSLLGTVVALALVGALLGVAANTARLWTTYEFAEETMRGDPILQPVAENNSTASDSASLKSDQSGGGLDWDYAMAWSNNTVDLLTGIIPGIAGGSSGESMDDGASVQALRRAGVQPGVGGKYQLPLYWGALPFTSGPIYFGAILLFLAVIGLKTVKSPVKWWLVSAILITVLLSYGKNAAWFNQLLFEHLPMFNKFRTPNSVLSVTTFLIPLLAVFGLYHWMNLGTNTGHNQDPHLNEQDHDATNNVKQKSRSKGKKRGKKSSVRNKQVGWLTLLKQDPRTQPLLLGLGITGGFALFVALFGGSLFSFSGGNDAAYAESGLLPLLIEDRKTMLTQDAFRTLFYILASAAIMTLFIIKPIRKEWVLAGLALLITADFWGVNRRYIEPADFQASKDEIQQAFYEERPIDRQIKELETSRHDYRVLDLSINTFNTNKTSYHHNTIGGYSAVKMRRIQDIIDVHISQMNMNVLNMLNTTYIITQDERLIQNDEALGWAWFVEEIYPAATPNEEINALRTINPAQTAVVLQDEFSSALQGLGSTQAGESTMLNGEDTTFTGEGTIDRTAYELDVWRYEYSTESEQLAVFSEMWYKPEKGLKATINGEPAEFIRVNYALRAIRVPAGEGTIEFRFEPASFLVGNSVTRATSLLLVLLVFGLMGWRGYTTYAAGKSNI